MGTRTVVLVRHGEYRMDDGPDPRLTELGLRQARHVEARLRPEKFDRIVSSTLIRARQTCAEIAGPWKRKATASELLVEGVPTRVAQLGVTARHASKDRVRFDEAYATFFSPARVDSSELLVCHGNLIRYLVARALDVPLRTWTRFVSNHCGITRILVRDGRVRVVSYNETAHLPHDAVT